MIFARQSTRAARRRAPFAAIFLVAFFAASSWSAAATNPISFELDRPDGVYAKDESASLTISVPPEFADSGWTGSISWQRNWTEDHAPVEWPVSSDPLVLKFPDQGPGLLIVTATLQSANENDPTHEKSIGLLFQPEAIPLSTPEPADFDEFWDEQKSRWRALPQKIEMTAVDSGDPAILAWDVTIHLENEAPVSGYLARPAEASTKSLPALISLHGAGFRSAGKSAAVNWAKDGFLALDINAHGFPNGEPASFYTEKAKELADFRARGVESPETWYFHGMYLRVVLGLDFLANAPEWNGKDLVVYGSSQGGAQAMAGAGLDPRVTVMAASVPAMCDLSGALLDRRGGWPRAMPENLEDPEKRAAIYRTFQYFDSGLFAKRTRAKTIVSLGLIDGTCPADGIQASINNLRNEVVPLYRPEMGHAIPADIKRAFRQFILERVTLPKN